MEVYTRQTELPNGYSLISVYSSRTNELVREETYYNDNCCQIDDYVNKNGVDYKIQKKYYENGILSEFSEFIRNLRVGFHKKYYNNGNIQFSRTYDTSGRQHGIHIIYHPDGSLVNSTQYNNGNIV
jgi:antitoxin component YwqK of YwqJK toxin-antitoxin module